jgi:hypothetical protein
MKETPVKLNAQQLKQELVALRRGWSLKSDRLRRKIGPALSEVCEIHSAPSDHAIRQAVTALFTNLAVSMSKELQHAMVYALAISSEAQFKTLEKRTEILANDQNWSVRTARRRVNQAFDYLAEALIGHYDAVLQSKDLSKGWQVKRFRALVRLDGERPELIEERTIVSVRNGLERIELRFTLPQPEGAPEQKLEVHEELLHGGTLESKEQQGLTHFRFVLRLPKPLNYGEEHTYTMVFRIPHGQPMRSHYVFQPLVACEAFRVTVRFNPREAPLELWRITKLAPRQIDDPSLDLETLDLDAAGEATLDFTKLEQGLAYGIRWLPRQLAGSADGPLAGQVQR